MAKMKWLFNKNYIIRVIISLVGILLAGYLVLNLVNSFYSKISNKIYKYVYPIRYEEQIEKYSKQYKIDKYIVFALIKAESGFDEKAHSNKDARGLMQVKTSTADWAAKSIGIKNYQPDDLYTADINIQIGCWYFRELMDKFDDNDSLAIIAYNAGDATVDGWIKNKEIIVQSDGKVYNIPFKETEKYLMDIRAYYKKYKEIYGIKKN